MFKGSCAEITRRIRWAGSNRNSRGSGSASHHQHFKTAWTSEKGRSSSTRRSSHWSFGQHLVRHEFDGQCLDGFECHFGIGEWGPGLRRSELSSARFPRSKRWCLLFHQGWHQSDERSDSSAGVEYRNGERDEEIIEFIWRGRSALWLGGE